MEEEKKKKSNVTLIVIIVILLIAVIGLCGYIFLNNSSNSTGYITKANDKTAKSEKSTEPQTETQNTTVNQVIPFDGSKSINSNQKNYTLSCQGSAGIWITVDSTQKVLTFSFTPKKVAEYYSLNWTSQKTEGNSSTINFEKKIVDVFFGGMGQTSSYDTVFILLEDGTVEYIPIVHMFNHVQAEVVSYGKINGVSDVTKFVLSSTSGGVTTLAIKNDGTFYDLWYALKDTGNY